MPQGHAVPADPAVWLKGRHPGVAKLLPPLIARWRGGALRALRSETARTAFENVLPALIEGVAGAAAGNQAKKAAEIQARNRLDELKLKNQQEQEGNARTSASVTGLRQPTGILNRGPLRRTDGTPIYTNGRIV